MSYFSIIKFPLQEMRFSGRRSTDLSISSIIDFHLNLLQCKLFRLCSHTKDRGTLYLEVVEKGVFFYHIIGLQLQKDEQVSNEVYQGLYG